MNPRGNLIVPFGAETIQIDHINIRVQLFQGFQCSPRVEEMDVEKMSGVVMSVEEFIVQEL